MKLMINENDLYIRNRSLPVSLGNMNISDRHLFQQPGRGKGTRGIHFRIDCPVIEQFQETFDEDRFFVAGCRHGFVKRWSGFFHPICDWISLDEYFA